VSVHLVTGVDPVLRDRVVTDLVTELLDGEDRSLVVEEFSVPGRGDSDEPAGEGRDVVGDLLTAASSPPFMTARRIVVVHEIGNLRGADVTELGRYLDDPLETTELVLVAGATKTADALARRVKAIGEVTAPAAERSSDVLAAELDHRHRARRPHGSPCARVWPRDRDRERDEDGADRVAARIRAVEAGEVEAVVVERRA